MTEDEGTRQECAELEQNSLGRRNHATHYYHMAAEESVCLYLFIHFDSSCIRPDDIEGVTFLHKLPVAPSEFVACEGETPPMSLCRPPYQRGKCRRWDSLLNVFTFDKDSFVFCPRLTQMCHQSHVAILIRYTLKQYWVSHNCFMTHSSVQIIGLLRAYMVGLCIL